MRRRSRSLRRYPLPRTSQRELFSADMVYYLHDRAGDKEHREARAESARLARKALQKSAELEAYLGLLDYRAGKVREIKSVGAFFRSLRGA